MLIVWPLTIAAGFTWPAGAAAGGAPAGAAAGGAPTGAWPWTPLALIPSVTAPATAAIAHIRSFIATSLLDPVSPETQFFLPSPPRGEGRKTTPRPGGKGSVCAGLLTRSEVYSDFKPHWGDQFR